MCNIKKLFYWISIIGFLLTSTETIAYSSSFENAIIKGNVKSIEDDLLLHKLNPDRTYGYPRKTGLMLAAKHNQTEIAKLFLAFGATIDFIADEYNNTALFYAANNGSTKVAKLLISHGANFNFEDKSGNNALFFSIKKNHTDTSIALIQAGINIDTKDNYGKTPLILAAEKGNDKVIEAILDRKSDIKDSDSQLQDALTYATSNANTKLVHILIKNGVNIKVVDKNEFSPLMRVVQVEDKNFTRDEINNRLSIIKSLLSEGADVNYLTSNGNNALAIASCKGAPEIIKFLIESGADINQNHYDDSFIPLVKAVQCGNLEVIQVLASNKNLDKNLLEVALVEAASRNNIEAAKLLIKNGADPNRVTSRKKLPLLVAADRYYPEMVDLLLENGADPNKTVGRSGPALMEVAHKKGTRGYHIVSSLIEAGADPYYEHNNGRNPFIETVWDNNIHAINIILSNGPKINPQKLSEAYKIARKRGLTKIIDILEGYGADHNITQQKTLGLTNDESKKITSCINLYKEVAQIECISNQLKMGADINTRNSQGVPLLVAAAAERKHAIVRQLLGHNANPDIQDYDGRTALIVSVKNNDLSLVKLLVAAGASLELKDSPRPLQGKTAIHYTVEIYNTEDQQAIIKYLINHGANINSVDGYKNTPLAIAAKKKKLDTVKYLLENGANVNSKNKSGATPLILLNEVFDDSSQEILDELIKYGADINVTDRDGQTVLMAAVRQNDINRVQQFINWQADVNIANNKGYTALMIAATRNKPSDKVIILLLKNGSNINHKNRQGKTVLDLVTDENIRQILLKYSNN